MVERRLNVQQYYSIKYILFCTCMHLFYTLLNCCYHLISTEINWYIFIHWCFILERKMLRISIIWNLVWKVTLRVIMHLHLWNVFCASFIKTLHQFWSFSFSFSFFEKDKREILKIMVHVTHCNWLVNKYLLSRRLIVSTCKIEGFYKYEIWYITTPRHNLLHMIT